MISFRNFNPKFHPYDSWFRSRIKILKYRLFRFFTIPFGDWDPKVSSFCFFTNLFEDWDPKVSPFCFFMIPFEDWVLEVLSFCLFTISFGDWNPEVSSFCSSRFRSGIEISRYSFFVSSMILFGSIDPESRFLLFFNDSVWEYWPEVSFLFVSTIPFGVLT